GSRYPMSRLYEEGGPMRLLQSHAAKLVFALSLACLFAPASARAQNAYITNSGDNTVSVIDTTNNTVAATITVGNSPFGVAVTPDGSTGYVANSMDNTVSVIPTSVNTETGVIPVGTIPLGVAVDPEGRRGLVWRAMENNSE